MSEGKGDLRQKPGPLNVLDLFAGCGGLSTGFLQAGGCRIVAACELNPAAAETYRLNHPGTVMVEDDITTERAKQAVIDALSGRRCDIVAGGIPCQAYTKSKHRDPNDPRGRLYEPFLDCVSRLSPSVVVIENVPDILTAVHADGTFVAERIAKGLREMGYAVGYRVLNAADFGVPQCRKRAFIFARRRSAIPSPVKTHDKHGRNGLPRWLTMADAIGDLADEPENEDWSHTFANHTPRYLERLRGTPIGGKACVSYNEGGYRNSPDRPCRTLRGGAWPIHYQFDRVITPREGARVQGFPDGFRFKGNKSEIMLQIGNAVPSPLAKAVGLAVLEMLDAGRSESNGGQMAPYSPVDRNLSEPSRTSQAPTLPRTSPCPCPFRDTTEKERGMSNTDRNHDDAGRKLRTLGLFAGCGGLDMGFEQSGGFQIVAANEFWKQAAATYRLNHPDTVLVDGDITSEEVKRAICSHFEKEACEAVIGGFPCQSFSVAGNRDQDDPRGALYEDYVDLVSRLHPLVVVMENVAGILSMARPDGVPVATWIAQALRPLGYVVGSHKLVAADFGVPQTRERVFIIAWRAGGFPRIARTHDEHGKGGLPRWRTFRDAVKGLPETNKEFVRFPEKRLRFLKMLKAGQDWRDLPASVQAEAMGKLIEWGGGSTGCYRRLSWDKPSPTVTCNPVQKMTTLCHPDEDRPLSIQEYRRIQQFPDDFQMSGSIADQYAQLGNAVPVGLSKAVAMAVRKMFYPAKGLGDIALYNGVA